MTAMELLAQADALDATADQITDAAFVTPHRLQRAQEFRDSAVKLREKAFQLLVEEERPSE